MNEAANFVFEQQLQLFYLKGDVRFDNAVSLYEQSLPLLNHESQWVIDLTNLTSGGSAAIALLIEWKKLATSLNKQITFQHMPDQILSIIHAAKMDSLMI